MENGQSDYNYMKVFVYKNLHKKCFSVKALEGENKGKVIAHVTEIALTDCVFKVSQAGRRRVLRKKQKNVHAGVQGNWNILNNKKITESVQVTYNPYITETFIEKETKSVISFASNVFISNDGVFVKKD